MEELDLGGHTRPVTTTSTDAQHWFSRGLVWTYAYHHEAAIVCFRRALAADPDCAMAHWGVAYAMGPNYNRPWEAYDPQGFAEALAAAHGSLRAALALRDRVTPVEAALIDALTHRYGEGADPTAAAPWNDEYAAAMRAVRAAHPDDLDVCSLFAEAIMVRTPWKLWDLAAGKPAEGADTLEAIAVLDDAFARRPGAWEHPGLLHMYIHLMEMSPHPERALRHGDSLAGLVPDAGHLLHMPTHVDVLCGDYQSVLVRNAAARAADERWLERASSDHFYTLYCCHNLHFTIYGAMFLAQPTPALEAAAAMESLLTPALLTKLGDWLEAFVPMRQHVLIRFGRWEEIVAQTLPEDPALYCVTTAMMHYARAVAFANLKRADEADREQELFLAARSRVPASRTLFNNTAPAILEVAEAMMRGEIAYHRGDLEAGFAHLRRSVAIDDSLPYDEPWGWMQPTRHALGALLLEQGRTEEAEAVYRADLGLDATLARACQHPNNVWSLHGLHECLRRRGETAELLHVRLQLERARARAEVPIRASCLCRKAMAAAAE